MYRGYYSAFFFSVALLPSSWIQAGGDAEAKAIAAIKARGGEIQYEGNQPGKPVTKVSVGTGLFLDEAVIKDLAPHLGELKHLQTLWWSSAQLNDAGLKHLANLKQLKTFY